MQNIDAINLINKQIVLDPQVEPVLNQALRIAIYDEYKAFETYKLIIAKYGQQNPFVNLMQAEIRHYESLILLCEKYGVNIPINDIQGSVTLPNTLQECYELGVAAEIENIKMYDYLIPYISDFPDVLDVFYRLQAASYNNHLPTFRAFVANSNNRQDDMIGQINNLTQAAKKIASGEATQEEITNLFSSTNISLIIGLLTGGVGSMVFSQFFNQDKKQ